MNERFFYHSFPRRRASETAEDQLRKGMLILAAIRDFGLTLTPEAIEWRQPSLSGTSRAFPLVQRRCCFTELQSSELKEHGKVFGPFALEFEISALRSLGAVPVFYVPQAAGDDGNQVGVGLVAIATDTFAVISRLAKFEQAINDPRVGDRLDLDVGFEGSPHTRGSYSVDSREARNLLRAAGHDTAPLGSLMVGLENLLNLFYPTDNVRNDRALEYYRQREWRIATSFAIRGKDVMRLPTNEEISRLFEIDRQFFDRPIAVVGRQVSAIQLTYIYPGINGARIIELVRRVIVPNDLVDAGRRTLAPIGRESLVVSQDEA